MSKQRSWLEFVQKGFALVLVVSSLVVGMIGVGLSTEGRLWAILLILASPFGIWAATRVTPEAGTTGYCDDNL